MLLNPKKFIQEYFSDCDDNIAVIDYQEINKETEEAFNVFADDMRKLLDFLSTTDKLEDIFPKGKTTHFIGDDIKELELYKFANQSDDYERMTNGFLYDLSRHFLSSSDFGRISASPAKIRETISNMSEEAIVSYLLNASTPIRTDALSKRIKNQIKIDSSDFDLNSNQFEKEIHRLSISPSVTHQQNICFNSRWNNDGEGSFKTNLSIIFCNSSKAGESDDDNITNLYGVNEDAYPMPYVTNSYAETASTLHEIFHALQFVKKTRVASEDEITSSKECGADSFACLAANSLYGNTKEWQAFFPAVADARLIRTSTVDSKEHFTTPAVLASIKLVEDLPKGKTLNVLDAFKMAADIAEAHTPYKTKEIYEATSAKWAAKYKALTNKIKTTSPKPLLVTNHNH